jgi:cyanate permease
VINPFRSEARAFHFLLGVVAYCLAIAIAATAGGFWPALAVCIVLGAAAVVWWLPAGRAERSQRMHPSPHPPGERRILVIANETIGSKRLRRLVE